MSDYIDRQAAIKAVYSIHPIDTEFEGVMLDRIDVRYVLESLPSADVAPVRHGRWVEENPLDAPNCRLIKCSECGKSFIVPTNVPYADWIDGRNYCYGCGARMDGK